MDTQNAFARIINDRHGMMLLLYLSFLLGYFTIYCFMKKKRMKITDCPLCGKNEHDELKSGGDYMELKCRNCRCVFLHFDRSG